MNIQSLVNSLFDNGKTPMEIFGVKWNQIEELEKSMEPIKFECVKSPGPRVWFKTGEIYTCIGETEVKGQIEYAVKDRMGITCYLTKDSRSDGFKSLMFPEIKFRRK